MDNHQEEVSSPTAIVGIMFVSAYVDDFEAGYEFYSAVLGFEKLYDMGDQACYFKLGEDSGLYLEGGNTTARADLNGSKTTFTLAVKSASAFFAMLKDAGVETVEEQPTSMGQDYFWFRFYDPAGNLIEAVGNE